jgi:hypothetical protein
LILDDMYGKLKKQGRLGLADEIKPSIGDPPAVDAAGPGARLCEIKIVTLPIQVEPGERKG